MVANMGELGVPGFIADDKIMGVCTMFLALSGRKQEKIRHRRHQVFDLQLYQDKLVLSIKDKWPSNMQKHDLTAGHPRW